MIALKVKDVRRESLRHWILPVVVIAGLFVTGRTTAAPVTGDLAQNAGLSWVASNIPSPLAIAPVPGREAVGPAHPVSFAGLQYHDTRPLSDPTGKVLAYIINMSPKGYVVLSADDSIDPILSFSTDSNYIPTLRPNDTLSDMLLTDIPARLARASTLSTSTRNSIRQDWDRIESGTLFQGAPFGLATESESDVNIVVDQLLQDSEFPNRDFSWNQGNPYNDDIPQQCATGCVATALAMMIRHWRYPPSATGNNLAVSVNGTPETYSIDSSYLFNYDLMPPNFDGANAAINPGQVATLMYDCGLAVNIAWGTNGSGGPGDVSPALINNFHYKHTAIWKGGADPDVLSELQNELNDGRPTVLATDGHEVVCDGWGTQSSSGALLFHLNLGWGGGSNGWYSLPIWIEWTVLAGYVEKIQPPGQPTVSITSSTNPSKPGQPVTFTAAVSAVAPATSTPPGAVTFLDGTTTLRTGPVTLDVNGQASLAVSTLSVGSHSITATYSGNSDVLGATSAPLTQVVNSGSPTVALTSSFNPSVSGQSVTFTAAVPAVDGTADTPTGTVTFLDGAAALGSQALAKGAAAFSTTALAAGSHRITASYSGDGHYGASASAVLTQAVNNDGATVGLTSSLDPSSPGQSVTFTAAVSPISPAAAVPTGSVVFMDGTTTLGTGVLSNGQAAFSTSSLAVGLHTITGHYSGDSNFGSVTSGILLQRVAQAGSPWSWGANSHGESGNNTTTSSSVPVQVDDPTGNTGFTGVIAVAAGSGVWLALKCDGTAWAWGNNSDGEMGNNITGYSSLPVQVQDPTGKSYLTGVVAIATECDADHSLALKSDGTVWAWGDNGNGELGNNSTVDTGLPVQVSGLTGVVSIGTGSQHSLAVKSDGTVWAWGANSQGELGNNSTTNSSVPVQVQDPTGNAGFTGVAAVAGGDGYSLALKSDGTVWAWGNGNLGNGTTQSNLPVQVQDATGSSYLANVTAIAAGYNHSLALRSDGTVWAWGDNYSGELGDNSAQYSNVPVQVEDSTGKSNLTGVLAIAAGNEFSLVVKSDGSVWGWGADSWSQMGNGKQVPGYIPGPLPVRTPGLTDAIAIGAGGVSGVAIASAAPAAALVSSKNPAVVGQPVTFTVTISAVVPATGTPTGIVTFLDGANILGTQALSNGVAAFSTSTLIVGSHTITASYSAGTSFSATNSTALTQVIQGAGVALISSADPSFNGQSVTFTASVLASPSTAGIPRGTITFRDGPTTIGAQPLSNGQAAFATSTLTVGSHSITASYSGDANYGAAASTPLPQVVNNGGSAGSLQAWSPWPMFRRNAMHTGQGMASGAPGTLKWKFTTGSPVHSSPTIAVDGTIYVGSWDANAYAINPDGSQKWKFPTGNCVFSSPAIGADGTIYVATWGGVGDLYALNPADGSQKWAFATGDNVAWSSPAIGPDGTIYIGSENGDLFAVNPADGSQKWKFTTGGLVDSSPAIGADGTIYVGSWDNNVYAIDPTTGLQKWKFTTGSGVLSSPSIGSDGTIYVGSWDNNLYAINPTDGSKKWSFTTGDSVFSSAAIGADGTIYVGSYDDNLYAINPADGSKKWQFTTGSPVDSSPAIGADGTIYVGSEDNNVYAINPANGSQKWKFTTAWPVESSPAIGADGTIYVGSDDDNLYAIGGTLPSVALTSSQNPAVVGQPVAFTVTVSPVSPAIGTPTGTVTFLDGTTTLGTQTLTNGQAAFTDSALSVGSHTITVTYSGDSSFNSAASPVLTQLVNKGTTSAGLSSSSNPSVSGQPVTLSTTVSPMAPAMGSPTGTVTFLDGRVFLGSQALSNGTATFSTSTLAVGAHSIMVYYAGDTNFTAADSAFLAQVVNKGGSVVALASNANPSLFAGSVMFTATVTAASPAAGTPTGTVTFLDGTTIIGTQTLTSGQAALSTSALSSGTHVITASYSGDTNFTAATSAALAQAITGWAPLSAVPAPDGTTHLLWGNGNGRADLRILASDGSTASDTTFGPFTGWQALALSVAPDNTNHILWQYTNGTISIWKIDEPGDISSLTYALYGPFAGWNPVGIATATDSSDHVLWRYTDNTMSTWRIDPSGSLTYRIFGPYAGWTPIAIAAAPDLSDHVLWNYIDNTMSTWRIDPTGTMTYQIYGAFGGWKPVSIGVDSKLSNHILWNYLDSTMSMWNLSSAGALIYQLYGPYAPWSAATVNIGPDDHEYVLWTYPDGTLSVWNISSPGVFTYNIQPPPRN